MLFFRRVFNGNRTPFVTRDGWWSNEEGGARRAGPIISSLLPHNSRTNMPLKYRIWLLHEVNYKPIFIIARYSLFLCWSWIIFVFQARPCQFQRASTLHYPRVLSPTSRTSPPATSTSRRRGSSGRRCPSKTSSLGRPSQLGELGKLVGRGTKLTSHMHQQSVSGAPLDHSCLLLPIFGCCCLQTKHLNSADH